MNDLRKSINVVMAIVGWIAVAIWTLDWIDGRKADKPEIQLRKTVNRPDSLFTDDSIYVVTKKLDTVIVNNDENYKYQKWADGQDDRR